MNTAKLWLVLAALVAAAGVALGAYHAHGLEKQLAKAGLDSAEIAKRLDNCEVAVRYQMYHALGLLGVGILASARPSRWWTAAAVLMLLGMLLFSGGLYLIVFAGNGLHWAIVPSGGLLLILAWLTTAAGAALAPRA